MRVVWTEPAETDLDNRFDYIARDSPIYAERFVDRILDAVVKLAELPRVGRQVPEANADHINASRGLDYFCADACARCRERFAGAGSARCHGQRGAGRWSHDHQHGDTACATHADGLLQSRDSEGFG
jgi:plasmid stabilization system protein ParE